MTINYQLYRPFGKSFGGNLVKLASLHGAPSPKGTTLAHRGTLHRASEKCCLSPQESTCMTRKSTCMSQESTCMPLGNTCMSQENSCMPQKSAFEPLESSFVPQGSTFVPQGSAFEPPKSTALAWLKHCVSNSRSVS